MRLRALIPSVCLVVCNLVAAAPVTVTGKVVTDEGEPITGADVWIYRVWPEPGPRGTSGPDGAFELTFDPVEALRWQVLAVAEGRAVGSAIYETDEPSPVTIELKPSSAVRGVVTDATDKPVAGADVRLTRVAGPGPADERSPLGTTVGREESPIGCTTGADGRFRIDHVPDGAEVDLMVFADGYATWSRYLARVLELAVGGAHEDYVIRLQPAAVVEGRVTHAGEPVSGVHVFAQGLDEMRSGGDAATTDGNGCYRLRRLGSGHYNIAIDEAEGLVAPAHAKVPLVGGTTYRGYDFRLTPGGVIEGRVLDSQTRAGIVDARVASYGPHRPRPGAACMSITTDQTGTYRMRVPEGRSYVYHQGGLPEYSYSRDVNFEIDVREGQTVRAPNLVLTRRAAKPGDEGDPAALPHKELHPPARLAVIGGAVLVCFGLCIYMAWRLQTRTQRRARPW
jgi:hypothetical protein